MRIHNITTDDMLNGDGLRVVLWVAGCSHHCEGCQNLVTWNPYEGIPFDDSVRKELMSELDKEYIEGITLSGGDPLYYTNCDEILALVLYVKSKYPNKTIWMYTGYTWEYIMLVPTMKKIVSLVDVVVDGEFAKDLADTSYPWAGSTNQRVIDVYESLKRKEVVLHESH